MVDEITVKPTPKAVTEAALARFFGAEAAKAIVGGGGFVGTITTAGERIGLVRQPREIATTSLLSAEERKRLGFLEPVSFLRPETLEKIPPPPPTDLQARLDIQRQFGIFFAKDGAREAVLTPEEALSTGLVSFREARQAARIEEGFVTSEADIQRAVEAKQRLRRGFPSVIVPPGVTPGEILFGKVAEREAAVKRLAFDPFFAVSTVFAPQTDILGFGAAVEFATGLVLREPPEVTAKRILKERARLFLESKLMPEEAAAQAALITGGALGLTAAAGGIAGAKAAAASKALLRSIQAASIGVTGFEFLKEPSPRRAARLFVVSIPLIAEAAIRTFPKIRGEPKLLKGAAKTALKQQKKTILTNKKFIAQLIKESRKPPEPPRITKVVAKGDVITLTIKSGDRVLPPRVLSRSLTSQAVINAQLRAAQLQGATFVNIAAPKVITPATTVPTLAASVFDIGIGAAVAATQLSNQLKQDQQAVQRQNAANLAAMGIKVSQRDRQRQFQAQSQMQSSLQKQLQSQAQAQRQAQKQAQKSLQSQFQAQISAQSSLQSELQAQAQAQRLTQSQMIKDMRIERPRVAPRERPGRVRPPPIPILLPPEGKPKARPPVRIRREGYDAIAKVRGKAKKIADNVSRISALSLGSAFVDQTPAASFTIKKTGRVASGRDIFDWEGRKFKFRPPIRRGKPVKSEIIIEKNRFRIDTIGEIAGIPQEAKRLREAGLSPRKIRKTKTGEIDLRGMI